MIREVDISPRELIIRVDNLVKQYGDCNLPKRDQELWEILSMLVHLGTLVGTTEKMGVVSDMLHLVYRMGFDDGTKS